MVSFTFLSAACPVQSISDFDLKDQTLQTELQIQCEYFELCVEPACGILC